MKNKKKKIQNDLIETGLEFCAGPLPITIMVDENFILSHPNDQILGQAIRDVYNKIISGELKYDLES